MGMGKPNSAVMDAGANQLVISSMVLLVDDQAMVAEALRRLLRDKPEIDLHYCPDAVDAIRLANEIKPHVIL